MKNYAIRIRPFMAAALISLILAAAAASAHAVEIRVESVPKNEAEFLKLRDRLALTPEGGAAVFVVAMMAHAENRDLGLKFFTIALDRDNLAAGNVYKGFKPASGVSYHITRLADPARKHVPYSYVSGTRPENGYRASPPFVFNISTNRYSRLAEDKIKVFVACSGASMPRPMTMRKNDKGLWKSFEISSFSLDVPLPKKVEDDL